MTLPFLIAEIFHNILYILYCFLSLLYRHERISYLVSLGSGGGLDETSEARPTAVPAAPAEAAHVGDLARGYAG